MRIAIIGAGSVGSALGGSWVRAGHEVRYAARDTTSDTVRAALTAAPGATVAPIAEAVAWSEVVVLATPWTAVPDALEAVGDFGGRPLLDATNPIGPGFVLTHGHTTSGGEQVQAWAPTARVVKAFNTTGWENMADATYPDGTPSMVVCGDDPAAKQVAKDLAADLGFAPLDLGGLVEARLLEPFAMVWIKLAIVQGLGRGVAFSLLCR